MKAVRDRETGDIIMETSTDSIDLGISSETIETVIDGMKLVTDLAVPHIPVSEISHIVK